jgi:hypothetical protein
MHPYTRCDFGLCVALGEELLQWMVLREPHSCAARSNVFRSVTHPLANRHMDEFLQACQTPLHGDTMPPPPTPHTHTHTHPSEPCQELTQAEFEKIQWSQLEEIMGRDILAKRFIDKEETGKVTVTMRDVWRKLDINQESTITVH